MQHDVLLIFVRVIDAALPRRKAERRSYCKMSLVILSEILAQKRAGSSYA
jgi:hypothetical protein